MQLFLTLEKQEDFMKLPTKRKVKSFFRRLWNAKEIYLIIIIVVGGAWMMARMADGIEKNSANKGGYFPQSELKLVYKVE